MDEQCGYLQGDFNLDQAKTGFWTLKKVLILSAILLGLLTAFLVAFFVLKEKKEKKLAKQKQEEEKSLKKFSLTTKDTQVTKEVVVGKVDMNNKDGYGTKTYSGFTTEEGFDVSEAVKKAAKYETTPNVGVGTIKDSTGKVILSNSKGLVVDGSQVITIDENGVKRTIPLTKGMSVELKNGETLDYKQLDVMNNTRVEADGTTKLLSGSTKANTDITTDSVKVDTYDENGTKYYSFDQQDISDEIKTDTKGKTTVVKDRQFNDILNNISENNSALKEEKNKVARKFLDTWLEKEKSSEVSTTWTKMVESEEVKYKDLKNKPSENGLPATSLSL